MKNNFQLKRCVMSVLFAVSSMMSYAQQTPDTDLTAYEPTVVPDGATFEWRVGPLPSSDLVSTPTAVQPGLYYGYFNFGDDCFSLGTPLSIITNTCPEETVDLDIAIADQPAGSVLSFHNMFPVSEANEIDGTDITEATAGVYYVAFKTTVAGNSCYSEANPIIVVASICIPNDCNINPSMIVSANTICPHDFISVSTRDYRLGATYNWSFGSTASPSTATGRGPHQVSYNACGVDTIFLFVNTDSCALSDTMIINIIDDIAPDFTVPPDQTVYFDAACTIDYSPLVTGEVTDETDNCASNLNASYTDNLSGLNASKGTGVIIRTWSLVDSCSNTTTQSQQITLRDSIWTTNPVDITIECDGTADPGGAISAWLTANGGGMAADPCGTVTFTYDYTGLTSSTCTGAGSATVIFTATDNCGNFSTRSGVLTISDTRAPAMTSVADITVDCNNIPAPITPIVTDFCDPDVSLVYQEVRIQHPDQNWKSSGSCSILYTVSDVFFNDKGTASTADDEVTFTLTMIGHKIRGLPGALT